MQNDKSMPGYRIVRASDSQRDGMGLVLYAAGSSECLAEVFYSDATGKLSISLFKKDLPLSVIGEFMAVAKADLPPIVKAP